LTSLKWDLEDVDKLYSETGNQADSSMLREKIESMRGLIDSTLNTVRRISTELRPVILDDLGLVAAIEWQAQQFEARTGIRCHFDSLVDNNGFSREQATAIFRILQEALTNILRHAHATRVNIIIEEDEEEFVLEIKDNGKGITEREKTRSGSLGIIGMRERAHLVGWRIEISGGRGKGTALTLRVPIPIALLSDNSTPIIIPGLADEEEL
jgi:signal transduction histidine kinase